MNLERGTRNAERGTAKAIGQWSLVVGQLLLMAVGTRICRFRSAFRVPSSALAILLFALPAFAQTKTIEIEQSGMQPSIQMGRPIPTWWDVKIKGSGLLEGRIEFQLINDSRVIGSTTTEDLALSGPEQRIRVMLPPVDDETTVDQLQVKAHFRGPKITQDLGPHVLRVALPRQRTFMTLQVTSRLTARRSSERTRLLQRLTFASICHSDLDSLVKTVVNPLENTDLPQEPMFYCGYDLVILFGDEFRLLKKPQLDAIAAWVRAGGSLYLEPTGVLQGHHVEFLRQLTAFDPRELVIQPDSQGRLVPNSIWEDERVFRVTSGLGRLVLRIDEENPDEEFDGPVWRQATAFLWRLHSNQVEIVKDREPDRLASLMPNGWWPVYDGNGSISQSVPNDGYYSTDPSSPLSVPGAWTMLNFPTSTTNLLNRLMPDGVQMVPLWVLGITLFSFVILIGPVDYFVLGRLKARKFTWVTFPLATILVTAFTVWITNRYMSSAETRRALIVRDLGDDGSTVRTNRFELLFVASSRPVTTEVNKGLFTALQTSNTVDQYQAFQVQGYQRRNYMGSEPEGKRAQTQLSGRIPTEFTATQSLAKWTPQLNRVFSIPGQGSDNKTDLTSLVEQIPREVAFESHSISSAMLSSITQQFGRGAMALCIGHNGRWAYDNSQRWYARTGLPMISYGNDHSRIPVDMQHRPDMLRWLYQHSLSTPYGIFGLICSTGPMGGPHLTDLPILDASDPNQMLLIIIVPEGDDFVAYRKLIRRAQ